MQEEKQDSTQEEINPFYGLTVRKSNKFITASYSATLLENRIMSVALSRIESRYDRNSSTGKILEAKLYPGEIASLFGGKTHVYRDLKRIAKGITGKSILIEDLNGNFHASALITDCDYVDSILTIRFNDRLRKHIFDLERNYTTMDLSIMIGFHRNSSFRIYELLKKEAYRIKNDENNGAVTWTIGLSEFKFEIGLIDSEIPSVKAARTKMKDAIDWDALYEAAGEEGQAYDSWWNLKARVLEPAKKELQERSNIRFEYEGIRAGRKVRKIRFTIFKNIPDADQSIALNAKAEKLRQGKERISFADDPLYKDLYEEFAGHNKLDALDIDMLLKKAEMNKEKVRNAIHLADQQGGYIKNYIGWLVRCIEEGYEGPTVVLEGSNEQGEAYQVLETRMKTEESKLAANMWNKIKGKDDYREFERYIQESDGVTTENLEAVYTASECVGLYTDWKRHQTN